MKKITLFISLLLFNLLVNAQEKTEYKKSDWSYGIFTGITATNYTSEFKNVFNNTLAWSLGVNTSYKKIHATLDLGVTNSKLNRNLIAKGFILAKRGKAAISTANINFGYSVFKNAKWNIIPFIGYGAMVISDMKYATNADVTGNFVLGTNIDFLGKKRIAKSQKKQYNTYIRARLFMTQSKFNPYLKGVSYNFGLAYGINFRSIQPTKENTLY